MTLTKNKMVREIGRRTRLKNRDVQKMLETLIEVWTEELASGRRIELENFFVLEVKIVTRQKRCYLTLSNQMNPISYRKLSVRASKRLRKIFNDHMK